MSAVPHKTVEQTAYPGQVMPCMDDAQFGKWVALLEQRAGIHLPESRRSFLVTSLNIRMRELGYGNYDAYYQYLISGRRGAIEWEILVDRLTIHETRFYRDENTLALIRDRFLTGLDVSGDESVKLDLWSVGCATGEEPYSLAILLDDYFVSAGIQAYVGITATDISTASLSTARKGVYRDNRLKNLPQKLRDAYFVQQDDGHHRIRAELQERVCFTRLNLLDLPSIQFGMMDIILCQNVLIYFKRELRIQILDHLAEQLRPGGLLILGAGEILDWKNPLVESVGYQGTLAYKRKNQSAEKIV